jgi:hypothetical protein
MRSFYLIFFTSFFLEANSQIQDLSPVLLDEMDLTAKGRDSIKKVAAQYNAAQKKISKNIPLTKKEKALVDEIENIENPALEMFMENGLYYYVGPPVGCCYEENGGPDSIWATSALDDKYLIDNIYDGSLDLAWAEGKSDDGVGEMINYKMIANAWPLEKIIIYNGYQKDMLIWKKNNRVNELMIYIDYKPVTKIHLKDEKK